MKSQGLDRELGRTVSLTFVRRQRSLSMLILQRRSTM
jgi:hypothetical protein